MRTQKIEKSQVPVRLVPSNQCPTPGIAADKIAARMRRFRPVGGSVSGARSVEPTLSADSIRRREACYRVPVFVWDFFGSGESRALPEANDQLLTIAFCISCACHADLNACGVNHFPA